MNHESNVLRATLLALYEGVMYRDGIKYTARGGKYKQWNKDGSYKELTCDQYFRIKDGINKNHVTRNARYDVRNDSGIHANKKMIDSEIMQMNGGDVALDFGGYQVKVRSEGNFRKFVHKLGVLPSRITEGVLAGLAEPMKMDEVEIRGGDNWLEVSADCPFGGIKRVFKIDNKGYLEVVHKWFVSEESKQDVKPPKGMSRKMLKDNFDLYKKMGVKEVRIKTDEDGSVIWAKAGFVPYSGEVASHLQSGLKRRLNRIRKDTDFLDKFGIKQDQLDGINKLIDGLPDRLENIEELANIDIPIKDGKSKTLGHLLLYDQGWTGSFNMDSEPSKRALQSYLSKR